MAKSIEALIEPKLLIWARDSAGYSVEEAAKKISVKPERLKSWEKGEKRPSIKQLRKIANVYKRPLSVFYLSELPKDFQPIRDFRHLPEKVTIIESPKLKFEIRRAQEQREIALDLYEELEGKKPAFSAKASLSEDPEQLAIRIRNLLKIKIEDQFKLKDKYEALNWWRTALENFGVLTFQATGIEISEMRGFSISETPFPVVVANVKDTPYGRIFTMLHEFIHILLQEGGLCDFEETEISPEKQSVEIFCNRVAGEILVLKSNLLKENLVLTKKQGDIWSDEEINTLSNKYKVSREVILRRLLINNYISQKFYQLKIDEYKKKYESFEPQPEFKIPKYKLALSRAGKLFIKLALNNYYQEKITVSYLSDVLNLKIKYIGMVETEVMGHAIEFGAIR